MATRMDDFMVDIRTDDSIRFICVYSCMRGRETKRHILNMAFRVIQTTEPVIGWKQILNFFAVNVIEEFFLPLQSMNVSWQSLRVVKSGLPQRHPLNIQGQVNQEIGTLEKGLKIEFQRAYAKQPSFTYLYGMPINLEELEQKNNLYQKLETLYLDPIKDNNGTIIIQYRGSSNRVFSDRNRIISCTVRGELGQRKKYKKKEKKATQILVQ